MQLKSANYKKVIKLYLKFLKSQEILSEPFRDKIGQLNNFYLPISKKIFKTFNKDKKTMVGRDYWFCE